MWKTIGRPVFVSLLLALTACQRNGGDRLITPERVGDFTFEQKIPETGREYAVVAETIYDRDRMPVSVYTVRTADSVRVARIYPGKAIEVFSHEFKTEAGIHPGMDLREAVRIAGKENLNLFLEWSDLFVTVDDRSSGLSWAVRGDQMAGGWLRFEKLAEEGKPVGWDDFSPDAVISWIIVAAPKNGIEENTK